MIGAGLSARINRDGRVKEKSGLEARAPYNQYVRRNDAY
jgi:hypothetical protein